MTIIYRINYYQLKLYTDMTEPVTSVVPIKTTFKPFKFIGTSFKFTSCIVTTEISFLNVKGQGAALRSAPVVIQTCVDFLLSRSS